MSGPYVIVPLSIDSTMIASSTVNEPSASETAWVSGGTYVIGDVRIRTSTHRKYSCVAAVSGSTTPPESDPTHWYEDGPTDRYAMFDSIVSTSTTATTSMTVVLEPGCFNAIAFYGLQGSQIDVTVKDAPGGTAIYSYTGSLVGPYADEYDYCFGPYRQRGKLLLAGITPYASAELTIAITASTGVTVGCGMVCIGDRRPLILGDWGGTEAGAKAKPVDYSYLKIYDDGSWELKKRKNATDLAFDVVLPPDDTDYALATIQEVLSVPAAWIATDANGFDGLNVFGLGTADLDYAKTLGRASVSVKGLI